MFWRNLVATSTFSVCRYERQILQPQRQDELETMEAETGIMLMRVYLFFVMNTMAIRSRSSSRPRLLALKVLVPF